MSSRRPGFQFHLDLQSGVPIYRQIIDQVRGGVARGALGAGDQLPTVRQLSVDLAINPNTVARAYRELEMAGVVVKRRTNGTYVSDTRLRLPRHERIKLVTKRADALVTEARQMDIPIEEVIDIVRERDDAMKPAELE